MLLNAHQTCNIYFLFRKNTLCLLSLHLNKELDVRNFFVSTYEGWNFNSGNYLFTTDTK